VINRPGQWEGWYTSKYESCMQQRRLGRWQWIMPVGIHHTDHHHTYKQKPWHIHDV
jgi:hypothetical protein